MSRRQRKSFSVQQFFKNAAEVWTSSPHLRSKFVFENCFSCWERPFSLREVTPRKTNCVWFGRIASLSTFVLFAGGCVVRIADESFLEYSLLEVFLFLRWRTAFFLVFLRFLFMLIVHSLQGAAAPCTPRQAEPA